MGRFTDIGENKGFITDLFQTLQKSLNAEQVKNFANLENDEDRFKFVSQLDDVKNFQITHNNESIKNASLAMEFKQKGNKAFQQQNWLTALDFYNKALLLLPGDEDKDFSILLANRSAALYHMERYNHALDDIELAVGNYPKEMLYKLKERAARCHLAEKSYENALNSFKETITHLDNSKLPLEKRGKLEKDAQIMIKMLPRQIDYEKKMNLNKDKKSLSSTPMTNKMHKAITFDYTETEGRFAKTNCDIKVGEEILVESAFCATLMERFAKSHCQHCFARVITPLPCPNCVDVVFCSIKCRNTSIYSYHKFECGLLETIWNSGASINCHMAMRMISQRPLSFYKSIRDQLIDVLNFDEIKNLPSHDYRRVFTLVRHEKKRPTYSFLQYAFMSSFLVKFLDANHYFDSDNRGADNDTLESDRIFVGGLILRNLQILQFNAHEVFDLLKSKNSGDRQSVGIGAALYASALAFFNHSCNPSIVHYFKNTAVHVVSIRGMKAGDILSENYGPLYSQNSKAERKSKLKKFYWFDCQCDACEQNWPVFEDMNTNEIRFKCLGNKSCNNVITIPADCNDFMIQCIQCGEYTNILKGLKSVQDTEILEKTAKRLYKEGKYDEALKKYIEMMNTFEEVIAPPFRDYCVCQQAIKECLLEYGNRIQID